VADPSIIRTNREILSAIQARAAESKREGIPADVAGRKLAEELKAKYPAWDQPIRVWPAIGFAYKELP
jgi:hypothetical protein